MLSMTSRAATVLADVRERQGLPKDSVVRVFAKRTKEFLEIKMGFAPAPAEGDAVTKTVGTTLCVDADLAEPLSDAVIDAVPTASGAEVVFRT